MASPTTALRSEAPPPGAVDWGRYRDNLPRHLIGISRDLQARVMEELTTRLGFSSLRPSFGPLISLLSSPRPTEGRPLGVLARELMISKQACSQLADVVQAAGYLKRRSNPQDGRSKMLVLTRRGRLLAQAGVRLIAEREKDYAAPIGVRDASRWVKALGKLYDELGFPTRAGPDASIAVLPLIVDRLQQRVMEETMRKGHPELKRSYAQILLLIGSDGGRVFEMARLQNVSRQAISAVSIEIEGLGYLRRVPDLQDRRGRIVELTREGEALIADSVETVAEIESRLCNALGPRTFGVLERVSHDLYHALRLEETVFARSEKK